MRYNQLLLLVGLLPLAACHQANEAKPRHREIVDAVFGSGHIENQNQYAVMANSEGFLKQVFVAEGDTVRKGQVLYRLDAAVQQTQVANAMNNLEYARTNNAPTAPQIEQLKVQIVQARAKAQVDSLTYARYRRLVLSHAVSNSDMENAGVQYTASASNLNVLENNLADLQHTLTLNLQNAQAQYDIQHQNND
jgi:macrolide-specific efflux system membrane fusion protein